MAARNTPRSAFRDSGRDGAGRTSWRAWCACWLRAWILLGLCLLTNPAHVLGGARRYKVRGRWLRKAAFLRLSWRAAATVQGAHAGGHGTLCPASQPCAGRHPTSTLELDWRMC